VHENMAVEVDADPIPSAPDVVNRPPAAPPPPVVSDEPAAAGDVEPPSRVTGPPAVGVDRLRRSDVGRLEWGGVRREDQTTLVATGRGVRCSVVESRYSKLVITDQRKLLAFDASSDFTPYPVRRTRADAPSRESGRAGELSGSLAEHGGPRLR
jgi:hypothetical protein